MICRAIRACTTRPCRLAIRAERAGYSPIMSSLIRGLLRGATAGAAGTTALNVASGIDAAVRARPSSTAPQQLVAEVADRVGVDVPGNRKQRQYRLEALGPLAGAATGLAVGAVAGGLRAAGLRMPTVLGGPVLAAAAMLATDGPLALTKVSDPRSWSEADWRADILPHLAYGIATHRTLVALTEHDDGAEPPTARVSTLARAVALGAATGSRSSAGLTAVSLTSTRQDKGLAGRLATPAGRLVTLVLAAGELVADKRPSTPPRTDPRGAVPRVVFGATTAAAVAARAGEDRDLPALLGAGAALASAVLGVRWRAVARKRFGSDLPGALAEDVVAAALGWLGARASRKSTPD
jgi:uncharacterized membrane protein